MEYRIFTDGMEQEDVININDPFDAESYYEENKYFSGMYTEKQKTVYNSRERFGSPESFFGYFRIKQKTASGRNLRQLQQSFFQANNAWL